MLAFLAWSGHRGYWRFGHDYDAMHEELTRRAEKAERESRDNLILALSGTTLADKALALYEKGAALR